VGATTGATFSEAGGGGDVTVDVALETGFSTTTTVGGGCAAFAGTGCKTVAGVAGAGTGAVGVDMLARD